MDELELMGVALSDCSCLGPSIALRRRNTVLEHWTYRDEFENWLVSFEIVQRTARRFCMKEKRCGRGCVVQVMAGSHVNV